TLKNVLEEIKTSNAETISKYPLTNLLTIFQKVCDAVSFAHSKGVIHRDLKPENVMLGDFGEVLVMDWGLAKILQGRSGVPPAQNDEARERPLENDVDQSSAEADGRRNAHTASDPIVTLEGRIMGTPNFMSPEQAEGRIRDIDERSDIFALG